MLKDAEYILGYYKVSYSVGEPEMYWEKSIALSTIEVNNSAYTFYESVCHYSMISAYFYLIEGKNNREPLGNLVYNV